MERYALGRKLGEGSFGEVFLARLKATGEKVGVNCRTTFRLTPPLKIVLSFCALALLPHSLESYQNTKGLHSLERP
jgi:serine/threonine protein kinase